MSSINKIASFAVLHLQTTGVPGDNFDRANITEIKIHSIGAKILNNESAKLAVIPRVHHTLTILFNPRMHINPNEQKMSGLENSMLEDESSFDNNAATVIISFIKHLKQPVCLVSHEGNKLDFPLLKHALENLKMNLPSDVRCIDSSNAIRNLDNRRSRKRKNPIEVQEVISHSQESNTPTSSKRKTYTLDDIYIRCLKEDLKIDHLGEVNVTKLEQIILYYGNKFVEYADANAKPFADIKSGTIY